MYRGAGYTARIVKTPILTLALLTLAAACSVTQTGRSRIALFSEPYMNELGTDSYDAVTIDEYRLIDRGPEYERLQRVGRKIAAASGKDYAWEFRLLDAPDMVNAFCLPGGKVAVYTGLLKLTQNEDALAAVVGHEVAHATEEHGNERMTHGVLVGLGMSLAEFGLDAYGDMDGETQGMVMAALGAGAQVGVVLRYSRTHETEADHVGLVYLVRAGYDPHEAPRLWERMAAASTDRSPEWFRTHPDPLNRAEALRRLIPRVLAEEGRGGTRKQLDPSSDR